MVKSKSEVLRPCPLFSILDPSGLDCIAAISSARFFQKNEFIFQEGQAAAGFFVVARGQVKIYKLAPSGSERILHIASGGDAFAEAVVFGGLNTYPAFAQALRETEALFIPRRSFLSLMKADFFLCLAVLGSMAERLRYFNNLVEELSLREADARLAKYLLDLSLRNRKDSFLLDVKKVELARRLGIAPETLSRLFKKFLRRRLLRLEKDRVSLCDKERLRAVSSGEGLT